MLLVFYILNFCKRKIGQINCFCLGEASPVDQAGPNHNMCDEAEGSNVKASVTVPVQSDKTQYGGLFLLGCNGSLPTGDCGRKRSRFLLEQRDEPNGVKKAAVSVVRSPNSSKAVKDPKSHSISFSLTKEETIVVEYAHDKETDMFQIGRAKSEILDFIVRGTFTGESTISRFACRIIAGRSSPSSLQLCAAGFDEKNNIFLGEKAVKWKKDDGTDVDALTTNGVLLNNPKGTFCGGELEPGVWREVSVCGNVLSLRSSRSSQEKGREIEGTTSILRDGSLIDVCGATLLWRSAEGLKKSATKEYIESLVEKVNRDSTDQFSSALKLAALTIPRKSSSSDSEGDSRQYAHVFFNCGHVCGEQSPHDKCPSCRMIGPAQKICMGMETAFYVDDVSDGSFPKLFAFNPCGHIATEKTVKYWSKVSIPHGASAYEALCPFCATELEGNPGYVCLQFNENVK